MNNTRKMSGLIFLAVSLLHPLSSKAEYQVGSGRVTQIQQFLENLKTSSDPIALDLSFLGQVWVTSFNSSWPSSNSGAYATGKLLPVEIKSQLNSKELPIAYADRVADVLSGGVNPVLVNQDEYDSYAGITAVMADAVESDIADAIPKILNSKRNATPPTKGDVVIYNISAALSREAKPFESLTEAQRNSWKDLALSQNVIYRLIAARTYSSVSVDPDRWAEFYAFYAGETDPDVVLYIIDKLTHTKMKKFIATLQSIEAGQNNVGNKNPAQRAKEAVKFLQESGIEVPL